MTVTKPKSAKENNFNHKIKYCRIKFRKSKQYNILFKLLTIKIENSNFY